MKVDFERNDFNSIVADLAKTFRVFAPVVAAGAGTFSAQDIVAYGEVTDGRGIVTEGKSYFSAKEILFPPRETLFTMSAQNASTGPLEHIVPMPEDNRDILVFLRPCDIHAVKRLDRIFLENGSGDFYYERRRKKIKFLMIECVEGFDSCFCVSMKTNEYRDYAAALRFDHDTVSIHIKDDALSPFFSSGNSSTFEPRFALANKTTVTVPDADTIKPEHFTSEPWKEYTRRCVNCGRCNTSCPTCSCFTMQDAKAEDGSSFRRRRWAGCHVNGFSDMAGGHSFRKLNGERMRFKTLHKMYDFKKRFGEHMCVGCGRCDDVCPEYISFAACVNMIGDLV